MPIKFLLSLTFKGTYCFCLWKILNFFLIELFSCITSLALQLYASKYLIFICIMLSKINLICLRFALIMYYISILCCLQSRLYFFIWKVKSTHLSQRGTYPQHITVNWLWNTFTIIILPLKTNSRFAHLYVCCRINDCLSSFFLFSFFSWSTTSHLTPLPQVTQVTYQQHIRKSQQVQDLLCDDESKIRHHSHGATVTVSIQIWILDGLSPHRDRQLVRHHGIVDFAMRQAGLCGVGAADHYSTKGAPR